MINLNLQQVCFSYSNGIVLNNINLSIKKGQMVGLLGPNGSGKTTLIKLVSGILHPKKGSILLDYINIDQLSRNTIAQKVAVVPQQFNMPFSFTVNDLVMFGRTPFIKLLAGEKETDRRAVSTTMEIIGIDILKHRLYNELSG
ncbi:MAG: ABC transporter ATP-binding protein, partial [Chloroflexi bacterium]|nr:ABC transporter ATP-binding protein [Chloroflexota bacterium]